MKKIVFILAALAMLFACNPVEPYTPGKPNDKPEEKPDDKPDDNTIHVTGISLSPTSITITEEETANIVAAVKPDNADNKTVLDAEDDVARAKLGGNWRMPTEEEWNALKTKCRWEWKVLDGVFGQLVTATNGNRLFLPAAGYMNVATLDLAGSYGYYWSTSLSTTHSRNARAFYFLVSNITMYDAYRSYGCPVRAVTE